MATIQEIKDRVSQILPNAFSINSFIAWCNEVDALLKDSISPSYAKHIIQGHKGVSSYDLPPYIKFQRIERVFVGNTPYQKIDVRSPDVKGFFLSGGDLTIEPPPVNDLEISVVYKEMHDEYESAEDELMVAKAYEPIYVFYCMAQIKLSHSEMEMYDNYILRYNEMLAAYEWHTKRTSPQVKRNHKIRGVY